jgi:hypothetical protein
MKNSGALPLLTQSKGLQGSVEILQPVFEGKVMRSDQVEFYSEIKREIEFAALAFDGINDIWLPKSQIEIKPMKHPDVEITLPEWLAKEKEII